MAVQMQDYCREDIVALQNSSAERALDALSKALHDGTVKIGAVRGNAGAVLEEAVPT